jgi:alkylation response protein AidB-like acyl-CoA dehydrogenase
VLDGAKVLVTGAHKADRCATIARTDPDSTGRRGISMFLVDLATPGVTVERVPTANGWTLATVRFERARVGADTLLGTEGDGWRQVTAALLGERSGMAWLGWATRSLDALLSSCAATDRLVRDALADLVERLFAAMRLAERVLARQDAGESPLVDAAMSKVAATELLQRVARVGAALAGPAVTVEPGWFGDPLPRWFAYEVVERLHPTLSVGANEIQRTTIGQAGLGLPAEPARRPAQGAGPARCSAGAPSRGRRSPSSSTSRPRRDSPASPSRRRCTSRRAAPATPMPSCASGSRTAASSSA